MFRHIRLIGALARNDWRLFLADRRAVALYFLVPIVLGSAFGIIFDHPERRLARPPSTVLVVVEDASPVARQIVEDLEHDGRMQTRIVDRSTAELDIERRTAEVAIILPPGFGRALSQRVGDGADSSVLILHHPLSEIESSWVEGVFTKIVMRRAAQELLAPLGVDAGALDRPFALERRPCRADRPFNAFSHSFSGMTLQYLLFWGMEGGLLLLRERQRGIWARARCAPASLCAVLLGRACATAMIAMLLIAATFGFGYLAFGVSIHGSAAAFVLLALAMCLLSAGVGLLVASVGRSEAGARSIFIVIILAVSMFGGLWLPSFLLPRWVQTLAKGLPTSWAMRGLDQVTWQGSGLAVIWPSLAVVYLYAAAFLTVAICRFHLSERNMRRGGFA